MEKLKYSVEITYYNGKAKKELTDNPNKFFLIESTKYVKTIIVRKIKADGCN